jgi:hypothetical protein
MHESKHFNCILEINLAMASSGASGGKTSDQREVCIECHGCQRVVSSWWRYDQHRHIAYLRVLCWARYQQNEPVCKAAPKHVHCCSKSQRCSSSPNTGYGTLTKKLRILHILHILRSQCIQKIKNKPTRCCKNRS